MSTYYLDCKYDKLNSSLFNLPVPNQRFHCGTLILDRKISAMKIKMPSIVEFMIDLGEYFRKVNPKFDIKQIYVSLIYASDNECFLTNPNSTTVLTVKKHDFELEIGVFKNSKLSEDKTVVNSDSLEEPYFYTYEISPSGTNRVVLSNMARCILRELNIVPPSH